MMGLIIRPSVFKVVQSLEYDRGAMLLYAILAYGFNRYDPNCDPLDYLRGDPELTRLYYMITPYIAADQVRYARKQAAGRKGGRPRKTQVDEKPT